VFVISRGAGSRRGEGSYVYGVTGSTPTAPRTLPAESSDEKSSLRSTAPGRDACRTGMDFVLRLADGTSPVTLPDPGSGTFDAAGGFDGVLFISSDALEVLSGADPYGDNVVFTHDEAEGMLRDIEILLARDIERHGPARRVPSLTEAPAPTPPRDGCVLP
jgi:hypothetical protein